MRFPTFASGSSLLPYDEAAHRDLMAALAACGRIAEVDAHLEAATHLFKSQGLSSAPLDKAWREHRQPAARGTRPESSPLSRSSAGGGCDRGRVGRSRRTGDERGRRAFRSSCCPSRTWACDPEQEYFVDGVTESLTTDLSRIPGSFVIARNTAFSYKGKPVDARAIGRELNVRYVLEGSVQRSGARMRVNVQLIDAESGSHLWADRFDKPVADLFDMQDEIVARLANALDTQLVTPPRRDARSERQTPTQWISIFKAWLGATRDNRSSICRKRADFSSAP